MKRFLIAAAVMALCGCAPVAAPAPVAETPSTESACAAQGGRLERVGRAQTLQCVIPFADGGNACRDGGECQSGRCLGAVEASGQTNATGQCQANNTAFGCYTRIVNGRAEAAICVD
jgi:hypothetical protein